MSEKTPAIARFEQYLLVGPLLGCEPAAVHPVVDGWVHPLVDLIDGRLQVGGGEVHVGMLGNGVELLVEHADDVRRLVVDDGLSLLVPEHL